MLGLWGDSPEPGGGEQATLFAGASLAVQWLRLELPTLGAQVPPLDTELRSRLPSGATKTPIPQCTEDDRASDVSRADGEKLFWGPTGGRRGSETEARASGVLRRDWTWGKPSEEGRDTWLGVNKGSAGRRPARGPVAPGGRAGPVPGSQQAFVEVQAASGPSLPPSARRPPPAPRTQVTQGELHGSRDEATPASRTQAAVGEHGGRQCGPRG